VLRLPFLVLQRLLLGRPLTSFEAALGVEHVGHLNHTTQGATTVPVQGQRPTRISKNYNVQSKLWIVYDENHAGWIRQHLTTAQLARFDLIIVEKSFSTLFGGGINAISTPFLDSKSRRKERSKSHRPGLSHPNIADAVFQAISKGAPKYGMAVDPSPFPAFGYLDTYLSKLNT
jgi:hypothetical protein